MAGITSPGRSKPDFVSTARTSYLRRAPALLGTLLAGVLLLAACGQSVDGTGTGVSPSASEAAGSAESPNSPDSPGSAAGEPPPTEDATPDLPALTVENVAGGGQMQTPQT